MKCIKKNKKRITLTAEILEIDRITLSHYEHGRRLPSLNYMFKFCTLFSETIDSLLKVYLHNHYFLFKVLTIERTASFSLSGKLRYL